MTFYVIKLLLSAAIIVAVSEVAKRSGSLGALILSLPLISVLAMVWLYVETRDTEKIAQIAGSTFWLVLATLPMFLALQYFLKSGLGFYASLGIAIAIMAGCYALAVPLLARYGISM